MSNKTNSISILFEDDDLIVVNKPANFLTIPDRFQHQLQSVVGELRAEREEVFVVHRLDKATSGILCFAKNAESHKHLSRQFQDRTADKIYLALVDGVPVKSTGEINQPIAESMSQRGKMLVTKRGKPSLTLYKVIETFKHFSLIEATIKTGRTHQVRVHFQFISHPLAIDPVYGRREAFFLSEIKKKKYRLGKNQEERPLMSRTTLHAFKLSLAHPSTGERVHFQAEPPKDFTAILKQLRRWDQ